MRLPRILSEVELTILTTVPEDRTAHQIWTRVAEIFGQAGSVVTPEQVGDALETLACDSLLGEASGRWFMTDSGYEGMDLILRSGWGFAERADLETGRA